MTRTRLLLVGSSRSVLSVGLARAAARAAGRRPDVEVVAVCDTSPDGRPGMGLALSEAAAAVVKPLFGEAHPARRAVLVARGLPGPVVRPARGDPNDAAFLELVERRLRPDASLWLGSVRIAGRGFLRRVPRSVNYHNGSLPAVRGLHATGWSVYEGHPTTGYAFHLMDEEVDAGPVLVSGEIAIGAADTSRELEGRKTEAAAAALPAVLDAIVRGEAGVLQRGEPALYRQRDHDAVTVVGDPSAVSWNDLLLRLRAFGAVRVTLPAGDLEVTGVRRVSGARSRPGVSFVTADGVAGEAVRFRFVPLPLYLAGRRAERIRVRRRAARARGRPSPS